eukprot:g8060.t1
MAAKAFSAQASLGPMPSPPWLLELPVSLRTEKTRQRRWRNDLMTMAALPVVRSCFRRRKAFIWPALVCGPPAVAEGESDKDALKQRQIVGTEKAVEQYPQKYIEFDSKIIADRAYNMRSYICGTGGGPRALESVEWDPRSPNVSSVTIKRDGLSIKTETRVKKRTVAVPEGRTDLFNSSELISLRGSQWISGR